MATSVNTAPIHFEGIVADIARDFSIAFRATRPGPPQRIDGYTIGAVPVEVGPGPHNGELHPDGDEFLYAVSGTMHVVFDDGDEHAIGSETTVVLNTGDACIVPRGVWHRVVGVAPAFLVHVTPGPGSGFRRRN
jgi:mannose-6-phosphate isomerase-like protein (cupin superfamily)